MTTYPDTDAHVLRLKTLAAAVRRKEETLRRMKLPIAAAAEARKAERVERQIAQFEVVEPSASAGE